MIHVRRENEWHASQSSGGTGSAGSGVVKATAERGHDADALSGVRRAPAGQPHFMPGIRAPRARRLVGTRTNARWLGIARGVLAMTAVSETLHDDGFAARLNGALEMAIMAW